MSVLRAAPTIEALLLILATAAACSTNSGSSASPPNPQAVCPSTPEQTIGASCAVAGLRCGPEYDCGSLQVSLLCVCTDGVFQCTDGTGRQLREGSRPTCPMPGPGGACPSSERGALTASCDEQGLLCAYPSPCTRSLDQCQCFPGPLTDGGYGLRFECIPAVCPGPGPEAGPTVVNTGDGDEGGPLDSATETSTDSSPDSPADAGHDDVTDAPPGDTRAE